MQATLKQNPYWLINKAPNEDTRYRAMFNLSVKYQFNKLFSLQARGSADFINDKNETHMYAGTSSILAGLTPSRRVPMAVISMAKAVN